MKIKPFKQFILEKQQEIEEASTIQRDYKMFKAFYELVDGSVKQMSDIRDIIFGVFKETKKILIQKTSGNLRKMFSVDEIEKTINGHYSDLIDWLKSHGAVSMDPDDNRVAKAINKFVFN